MLKNYKVLKGTASALALDDDNDPHIEIRIEANGVAIALRSTSAPRNHRTTCSMPMSSISSTRPLTEALEALPMGLSDIRRDHPGACDRLCPRRADRARGHEYVAPFQLSGPKNDLRDFIEPIVQEGIADFRCAFLCLRRGLGAENKKPDPVFPLRAGQRHPRHPREFKATAAASRLPTGRTRTVRCSSISTTPTNGRRSSSASSRRAGTPTPQPAIPFPTVAAARVAAKARAGRSRSSPRRCTSSPR